MIEFVDEFTGRVAESRHWPDGLHAAVEAKEGLRSDIRINHNLKFFFSAESVTRLLPREKANRRIFDRALNQMIGDIARNKNNMLYNYRYKMQESLRVLYYFCDILIRQKSNGIKEKI